MCGIQVRLDIYVNLCVVVGVGLCVWMRRCRMCCLSPIAPSLPINGCWTLLPPFLSVSHHKSRHVLNHSLTCHSSAYLLLITLYSTVGCFPISWRLANLVSSESQPQSSTCADFHYSYSSNKHPPASPSTHTTRGPGKHYPRPDSSFASLQFRRMIYYSFTHSPTRCVIRLPLLCH